MKKTFLSRLLCMVLVAMLPLMAFAETVDPVQGTYTLTVTPGEALKTEIPALGDLFDVLALQVYGVGENAAGLSVLLSDEAVLSANVRVEEDGLYIESKEFYEKPFFISLEQLQTLLASSMEGSGMNNAFMEQYMQLFTSGMLSEESFANAEELSPVESLEHSRRIYQDPEFRDTYAQMTGGDETFLNWMQGIMDRMVVTEGEFASEDHDPANYQMEVVITQADYIALFDTTYVKQQIAVQVAAENAQLSAEELEKKTEETLQEAKETFENMDFQVPIIVLYENSSIVSIAMHMTAVNKKAEASEVESMSMNVDYRRLTTDGTIRHGFNMDVSSDEEAPVLALNGTVNHFADGSYDLNLTIDSEGKSVFSAMGTYTDKDDQVNGLLSVIVEDEDEILLQIERAKTEMGSENHLSFYTRTASAERLTLAENDKPMFTLNLTSTHGKPDGRLDGLMAATKALSVDILNLSTQELNTLTSDLRASAIKLQSSFLSKLPNSVLSLLMGTPTTAEPAE